jgi:hypothetical protein
MYKITANGSVISKRSSDNQTASPVFLCCPTVIPHLGKTITSRKIIVVQNKSPGPAVPLSLLLLIVTLPLAVILYISAMRKGKKP